MLQTVTIYAIVVGNGAQRAARGGVMSDDFDDEIDIDGISSADNLSGSYGFSDSDDFVVGDDGGAGGKKKKIILAACAALVVIVAIAFVVLLTQRPTGKEAKAVPAQKPLELNDTLLIPAPQALSHEYITGRVTGEKWSSEEAQKWFTTPSEKQLLDLGKINNHIVQEIVNSAP